MTFRQTANDPSKAVAAFQAPTANFTVAIELAAKSQRLAEADALPDAERDHSVDRNKLAICER